MEKIITLPEVEFKIIDAIKAEYFGQEYNKEESVSKKELEDIFDLTTGSDIILLMRDSIQEDIKPRAAIEEVISLMNKCKDMDEVIFRMEETNGKDGGVVN